MLMAVGTKVEVLASTVKKKGSKPRAGSQGYCVINEQIQHIGKMSIIVPASIVFTKFGYQTKRRSELKNVCLIYPKDQRTIKNVKPFLNRLLKNIKDYSLVNSIMQQVFNNQKIQSPELMIIRPIVTSETILNSENEFNSWLKCIFHSSKVRSILTVPYKNKKALVSRNFLKGLPCTLNDLLGAMKHKHKFIELSKFFFENPQYSTILRKNIAGLNQYFIQEAVTNALHPLVAHWKNDMTAAASALVLGSSERCLTPEEFDKFRVRLRPSTAHAYNTMWNWLEVLKTL